MEQEKPMEINIKTSFLSWHEKIENGITALIAITINQGVSFEALYWTDKTNYSLKIDPIFLQIFRVSSEEELSFYYDLLTDIESILPPYSETENVAPISTANDDHLM